MSLQAILEAIATSGDIQVRAIEEESAQRVESVLSDAHAEAERIRQQEYNERIAQASVECARIMQQARLSALRIVGDERQALMDQALQMTRKSLQVQRLTPRYSDVLRLLVAEALETLGVSQTGERSQIIADPRDRDLLQAILDEIPQEIPVRYDLTGDSGVIAESRDGRIRVINTFESRLEHALPYLQSQWGATLANDGASRAEQA